MRGWLVLVVVALITTTASADSLAPAAQARLDAGLRAYDAGHYELAIREIEAAYAIDPEPSLFYTLAQAERLAHRCRAAITHYRRYLDSRPGEVQVEAAKTGISLCEQKLPAEPACPAPMERPRWFEEPANAMIAGGVIGVGLGLGYLAAATSSRLGAKRAEFSDDHDFLIDRATSQRRFGVVSLTLGLALTGGGIGLHVWRDRKDRSAAVVSSDGRSLFIAGSF